MAPSKTEPADETVKTLGIGGLILIAVTTAGMLYAKANLLSILGALGSIASLVGLPIVLIQLRAVKAVSRATQDAVIATEARFAHTISAGDVARAIKMAEQVQWYASRREYGLSQLRLSDVRGLLIQFSEHASLVPADERLRFAQILLELGVEHQSLFSLAAARKKTFDAQRLTATLDELTGVLMRIEHQLRFPRSQ